MDSTRQTVRAFLVALLAIGLSAVEVRADCTGTCPSGYSSTCVAAGCAQGKCNCRCSCVKQAGLQKEIREQLQSFEVSKDAADAAIARVIAELKAGKPEFSVDVQDGNRKLVIHVVVYD